MPYAVSQHQTAVLHGVAARFSFTLISNAVNHWLPCCFLSTPMFCLLKAMVEAWPRLEKHDQPVTLAIPAAYATHLSSCVCVCV